MSKTPYELRCKLSEFLELKDPQHGLLMTGIFKAIDWFNSLSEDEQGQLSNFIIKEISVLNHEDKIKLAMLGKKLKGTPFEHVSKAINEKTLLNT